MKKLFLTVLAVAFTSVAMQAQDNADAMTTNSDADAKSTTPAKVMVKTDDGRTVEKNADTKVYKRPVVKKKVTKTVDSKVERTSPATSKRVVKKKVMTDADKKARVKKMEMDKGSEPGKSTLKKDN